MAKDKKSFILYADQLAYFENLENDEAGKLIKHILRYVNDLNPKAEDRLTEIVFEPIKQQLKRDLRDWEATRKKRSDSGKLGMEVRWGKKEGDGVIKEVTKDNVVINPITNITDNVNVNVNVKKEKNKIEVRKLKFASTLKDFKDEYPRKMLNDFYLYWTEPNKSNTKFRKELEKTWDLRLRLYKWAENDKSFTKGNKTIETAKSASFKQFPAE